MSQSERDTSAEPRNEQVADKLAEFREVFEQAEDAAREGDYATAREEVAKVNNAIGRLLFGLNMEENKQDEEAEA